MKVDQFCCLTAHSFAGRDVTGIAVGHLLLVLLRRHIVMLSLLLDHGLDRALGLSRGMKNTLLLDNVTNATSQIVMLLRHRLHLDS